VNRTLLGWSFNTPLTLKEMKTRLNSLSSSSFSPQSSSQWTDGDSAWYGDYLAGRLSPEAVGRIYPSGTGFTEFGRVRLTF
jgi:hypothetical protein